jgi:CBS domain-containing protein
MSPRAAWRLESLGFTHVYDYVAGKVDWLASGLPTEGRGAQSLRAKDGVRRDIPMCDITELLGDVRERVQAESANGCVVLNDAGIVLGYLRDEAFDADPEMTVEEAMDSGPTTIRPHVPLADMAGYLQKSDLDSILVTTADGQFVGMLYRQDAERMLSGATDVIVRE